MGSRNTGNTAKKTLKTREMLNMLNVFGDPPKNARSWWNTGNVKYVECVKCFGGNSAKNTQTFNIFNISPVLSIFGKKTFNMSPVLWTQVHEKREVLSVFVKNAYNKWKRNSGHVKYVKCLGVFSPISPKTFNIFNIFNISPVSSRFRK